MFAIRPIVDHEYAAIANIASLVGTEPVSAEELIGQDRRMALAPDSHATRFVAVDASGQVLGYANAAVGAWLEAGHFQVQVAVHPDHGHQGVGRALYEAAERYTREHGATGITAWCRSDLDEAYAWARRRGFVQDLLRTESVLDLTTWDGSRFSGALEKVRAGGIRLEAYEGETPEAIIRGTYDLDVATAPDVPDFEPSAPVEPYDVYRSKWIAYTQPRVTAVALDGDRMVGCSIVFLPAYPGKGAYTGYTGVLREYRGRGIALAVKLLTVEAALAHGAPRMRTNNDFENGPMLAVNTKLGYQMVPGPRRLKKQF
jgi:GNAT superfamily N-acetyltransferase